MKKNKIHSNKRQNGFSALDGILVIALLAILAVAGYFAFSNNKKITSATTPVVSSQTPKTTPPTTSTDGFLTITSWGVKGPLSEPISYTAAGSNIINLHSDEIASLYPSCQGASNAGDMLRLAPGTTYGTPKKPIEDYSVATKVGNYYYVYESGQQFCGMGNPQTEKGTALVNSIYKDLGNFQAKLALTK